MKIVGRAVRKVSGLTVIESLVTLAVCLLLAWIVVPVALVQLGIIKSETIALDSVGWAAGEREIEPVLVPLNSPPTGESGSAQGDQSPSDAAADPALR